MGQVTIIDLIRHGEPVGGKMYRGQRDDPLSDTGWTQMRAAVADHAPWQTIVSSTLSRCRAFAEEMAARHALPAEFDARLSEIGFGAWEGKTATQVLEENPDALSRFWRDPLTHRPPGAEPLNAFSERVAAGWRDLTHKHAGKHVLLVAHAGVMRMVIREVLGIPFERVFRIDVPYAGITRIRIDGHGEEAMARLVYHGDAVPTAADR